MNVSELRDLPAFIQAWPSCRDALMEFLSRRLLDMTAEDQHETGQQTLAKLIRDLEKLDSTPRPIVRPKMKPLNSMPHS